MAAGQSNDPAKILSDMLAAGQEILRKLGAPQTPSEAAASPGTPPDFLVVVFIAGEGWVGRVAKAAGIQAERRA